MEKPLIQKLGFGQEVIPGESTCDRQVKELPGLAGGVRQEPVAHLAAVGRGTRVGHAALHCCRWFSGARVKRPNFWPLLHEQ